MDFGFSGVIEKIEDHWGRLATKVILLFVGLGAIAVSVGAIWAYLLNPIVQLVGQLIPDHPSQHTRNVAKFIIFIAFALMAVNIGLSFLQRYVELKLNWRLLNRVREAKRHLAEAERHNAESEQRLGEAREKLGDAKQHMAEAEATIAELKELLDTAQKLSSGAAEALRVVFDHAVERKMLTPEQAAELDAFSDAWLPPGVAGKLPT